jgi:hypothetical protein
MNPSTKQLGVRMNRKLFFMRKCREHQNSEIARKDI